VKIQAAPIKLPTRGIQVNVHSWLCMAVGKEALCDLFALPAKGRAGEDKGVPSMRDAMVRS